MIQYVLNFFTAPVFVGDEEKTRKAKVHNALTISIMAVLALAAALNPFAFPRPMETFISIGFYLAVVFVSHVLNQQGYGQAARWFFISTVFCSLTVSILLSGGINNISLVYYIALTVIAGLLLGTRAAVVVAIVSLSATIVMYVLHKTGVLMPQLFPVTSEGSLVIITFSLIITTIPLTLTLNGLSSAIAKSKRENEEREKIEQALRQSEEKYCSFYEMDLTGNFESTVDGQLLACNPAFVKMFGFTSMEDALATPMQELYEVSTDREILLKNIRLHKVLVDHRGTLRTKSGKRIYTIESTIGIFNEDGTLTGIRGYVIDETERHIAGLALQESEEKYRLLVELSPDAIMIHQDGVFQYVNKSAIALFGAESEGELLGTLIIDRVHHEFRTIVNDRIQTIRESKTGVPLIEEQFIRLDGTLVDVEVCASPLSLYGKPAVQVIARDIKDRKDAERTLKQHEYMLRESQRIGHIGSYELNIVTGEWSSSDVLDEIFGILPDAEKTIESWTALVHPEEREEMTTYFLNEVVGARQPFNKEYRIVRVSDGEVRWLWGRGELRFNSENQPICMIGTIQDITESKRAQASILKLSKAVEQSPAAIIITDINGTIEYVNPEFTVTTGYEYTEAIGKNPRILKSGLTSPEVYKSLWKTIAGGNQWQGEFQNKKKNGEFYWESAFISHIRDEKGSITHYVAVKEDITEKKRVAEELLIAKEHAERSDKLKDEFIATISHEIRTPLNIIMGYSAILDEMYPIELEGLDRNEIFGSIDAAGKRLMRTIEQVLSLSRIRTGTFTYRPSEFLLDEVIDRVAEDYKSIMQHHPCSFECINNLSGVRVTMDKYLLEQSIGNLLDNAMKYTTRGYVRLTARQLDALVQIEIEDSGIGISSEYITRIFDPFTQEDSSYTRPYEGLGLGLSLVKNYVDLNGGTIEVESEKSKGSRFVLAFPHHHGRTESF